MTDTYEFNMDVEARQRCTAEFCRVQTFSGPFDAGTKQTIAKHVCKNTSDKDGNIQFKSARTDTNGNVISNIQNCSTRSFAGQAYGFGKDGKVGGCESGTGSNCNALWGWIPGKVVVNLPSDAGTYYYAFKIWGEDEDEPAYSEADSKPNKVKLFSVTVTATPEPEPVGDITGVDVDSKEAPEGGTIDWTVNKTATLKVYFKNTGSSAGSFTITVTDEDDVTLCSVNTDSIPADGNEYYVTCGSFTPDEVETKTLTAHIDP